MIEYKAGWMIDNPQNVDLSVKWVLYHPQIDSKQGKMNYAHP